MTLTQYQTHHNLTNAAMCRLINDAGWADIGEDRLRRLKNGKSPTPEERRAIIEATDGEVTSYAK